MSDSEASGPVQNETAGNPAIEPFLTHLRSFDGVLELAPGPGSEFPEIAWGDHFFYYAPDGEVPANTQPFTTVVTKNYPDDALSELDGPDRWRLNIHVGQARSAELTGSGSPSSGSTSSGSTSSDSTEPDSTDFAESDRLLRHPVYGALGWVCVVNPGERTTRTVLDLAGQAFADARRRAERRSGTTA